MLVSIGPYFERLQTLLVNKDIDKQLCVSDNMSHRSLYALVLVCGAARMHPVYYTRRLFFRVYVF